MGDLNTDLTNPLEVQPSFDLFIQTPTIIEPTTASKTSLPKIKSNKIIKFVIPGIFIGLAILFSCSSLISMGYTQKADCKKQDAPESTKSTCNNVGFASSVSSSIYSILLLIGISVGIYGMVKK
jgi:hypothetical protein